jgi:hypothetical protein
LCLRHDQGVLRVQIVGFTSNMGILVDQSLHTSLDTPFSINKVEPSAK